MTSSTNGRARRGSCRRRSRDLQWIGAKPSLKVFHLYGLHLLKVKDPNDVNARPVSFIRGVGSRPASIRLGQTNYCRRHNSNDLGCIEPASIAPSDTPCTRPPSRSRNRSTGFSIPSLLTTVCRYLGKRRFHLLRPRQRSIIIGIGTSSQEALATSSCQRAVPSSHRSMIEKPSSA
jgi:hypothetical protein